VKEVCITQVQLGVETMQGLDPSQWLLGEVCQGVWKFPNLWRDYL